MLENGDAPVETGPTPSRARSLLPTGFPHGDFTLAVEPILLTQLRDMADGYCFDAIGDRPRWAENDLAAQNAAATLTELAALAARESVEIVASPYSGADLGLLAAEGWRDGLEQVQMGKQELQRPLGLERLRLRGLFARIWASPARASPTTPTHRSITWSWAPSCRPLWPRTWAPGAVASGPETPTNDRVTLVFADGCERAPCGRLGTRTSSARLWPRSLAATPEDALVIAPGDLFGLMPVQYVQKMGEILTGQSWIRTQTLAGAASALHLPGSRPVLFETPPRRPEGYIESALYGQRQAAHTCR